MLRSSPKRSAWASPARFRSRSKSLYLTVSIGVALYPEDGIDAEALLKNADNAMYHAKDLGRNNVQFCAPTIAVRSRERLVIEHGLRRAIDRNEFVLHYQPLMALPSGDSRRRSASALETSRSGTDHPGRLHRDRRRNGHLSFRSECGCCDRLAATRTCLQESFANLRLGINLSRETVSRTRSDPGGPGNPPGDRTQLPDNVQFEITGKCGDA